MAKNVSLVTWIGPGNYGTLLQSYALHHELERLGYNVCFLNKIGVVRSFKLFFNQCFFRKKKENFSLKKQKQNEFIKNYRIKDVYTIFPKCAINKATDIYITGSDQIWNTMFYWDPFYFLYFAGRKKRIAYASSLGTNYINPKYKSRVKKYLLKFSHIGLREQSTVQLLSELLGRNDIVSVPDPTFLLTAKEWNEITQKAVLEFDVPEKYMFVYFVGKRDSYTTTLETIRKKHGIKQIIIVPSFESGFFNIADALIYKNAGPAEFVKLLQNATVICTDSFHASALSINLSKDFYVLKRFSDKDENSQNIRIYDLLTRYNLRHRLCDEACKIENQSIDYSSVQPLLEKDRKNAKTYLINSIEN